MDIHLISMTKELCRSYMQEFVLDPELFADPAAYQPYIYDQGFGTQAEILALEYAFQNLKMEIVYADALLNNHRSQHVLMKAGFRETHRDDAFVYYRCDRADCHDCRQT